MKKTPIVRALLLTALMTLPALVFAQTGTSQQVDGAFVTLGTIVNSFTRNIVGALSTLFATAAMAAFFFGIVQYIWGIRDGNAEKKKNGNNFMIWGLVALFVMFSVWGIVTYAQRIFGINGQNTIVIPQIQLQNGSTPSGSNPNAGLPVSPGTTNNNTTINGCPSVNASCTTTSGQAGTCIQGGASRDYALWCSAVVSNSSSCSAYTNAQSCQQGGCSWNNAELDCSQ